MNIAIRQKTANDLQGYSQVPMILTVCSRYRAELVDGGLGGWIQNEEPINPLWEKDYDEVEHPTGWLKLGI